MTFLQWWNLKGVHVLGYEIQAAEAAWDELSPKIDQLRAELAAERSLLKLAREEQDIGKDELSECRAELERTRQAMIDAQVEARRLIGAEKASEIETLTRERDDAREELAKCQQILDRFVTTLKTVVRNGDTEDSFYRICALTEDVMELKLPPSVPIPPKPAPRCPKCNAETIKIQQATGGMASIECMECRHFIFVKPIDAALDAWRPSETTNQQKGQ